MDAPPDGPLIFSPTPQAPTPTTQLSMNSQALLKELGVMDPSSTKLNAYYIEKEKGGSGVTLASTPQFQLVSVHKVLHDLRASAAGVPSVAGLQAPLFRDLILMDHNTSASKKPAILCRQGCIVLNLPPMRALIGRDKAWWFPEGGVDDEMRIMTEVLIKSREGEGDASSFELCVLYACLSVCIPKLRDKVELGSKDIEDFKRVLNTWEKTKALDTFHKRLQTWESELEAALADADGVLQVVQKLIETEADLHAMVLEDCGRAAGGKRGGAGGAGGGGGGEGLSAEAEKHRRDQAAKNMEILLEWFAASVEQSSGKAQARLAAVRTRMRSAEMALGREQAFLTKMQLGVQVITMGFAAMSVVSVRAAAARSPWPAPCPASLAAS